MTTSKKIILIATAVILVSFVSSVFTIRGYLADYLSKATPPSRFDRIDAKEFTNLSFSANWNVTIRQEKDYRIEVASGTQKSSVAAKGDTLYFVFGPSSGAEPARLDARISAPSLSSVRATGSTIVTLENFKSDSLYVTLEDGCVFTGKNNHFGFASFHTTGGSRVEFKEDNTN